MDGPVLSGGVIVLVAVLLWMLYLLPSWRGRFQYNAAERNAVRLNQALRVLAETSETPQEVRFELNARTALAQQKLAKRVQSEREAAELESLREQLAATRADPVIRRARARRRVRMVSTVSLLLGLAAVGFGVWQLVVAGSSLLLWLGGALIVPAGIALQRMAAVAARAARATHVVSAPVVERVAAPELHDQGRATWTPRPLPEPLVSVAGSRAQAAQDQIEAQEERRKAARVAALRERAEQMAPAAPTPLPAASSPYAKMGFVDDAEIEAHVRELLSRRAAG
ncbi:hypothetical protein V8Z69_08890 [Microbacterium aurugineum]|uniref:hypothetical protein n=1 Tax=Microbacterium TaxID=33882 RepID=UPI001E3F40C0|nr:MULTISPECIES: hypothetical protein [unclassified Microbacterium]MCE0510547.1 hypothetical protein [Microbacterium sp. KKR3/1]UUE19632.1 hypothetical protein LRQ07_12595 [Microbacterium sp. J1-1]